MSVEIKLRRRYVNPGSAKKTKSSPSGNSGVPARGTPPVGMRKKLKKGAKRYG